MYPEYPYLNFKNENVRIPITFPLQHQNIQPGVEFQMNPPPIFENPDCNDNWTRIFIYLFDNENSYFLCADSQTISEIGIWNCSVTSREYDAMKQNVLNTAGWIKESLPKRILSIESDEQNESLFIE